MEIEKENEQLKKKIKLYEAYMIKWAEQLAISGINSKSIVKEEIEAVLEDSKKNG